MKPAVWLALVIFLMLPLTLVLSKGTSESMAGDIQMRLQKYGPGSTAPERQQTLLEIDDLFMNDSLEPVKILLDKHLSTALWEISSSPVPRPTLWYFWNMGYILKTKSHVIGFDLPEVLLSPLSDEQKKILGQSLDMLFVSHVDTPHIDRDLVSYMRKDAYVVCPDEVVSFFDPIVDRKCKVIGMKIDQDDWVGPAHITAYFGDDRRGTPMRCYLVKVDGVALLHTADQHYVADWMKNMTKHVDFLMMGPLEKDTWNVEAINLIMPTYMVPGGIYDMSHSKDTWDGFPYAFGLKERAKADVVPMFFGEKLQMGAKTEKPGPGIVIVTIGLALAAGTGGALLWRRQQGLQGDRSARKKVRPREPECERRYVKNICLKCRYYVIRGGRPYCSKYNFELTPDAQREAQ